MFLSKRRHGFSHGDDVQLTSMSIFVLPAYSVIFSQASETNHCKCHQEEKKRSEILEGHFDELTLILFFYVSL